MIDQLKSLGFSDYEAKAYAKLIEVEKISAGKLAKLSEIPQGRIYGILESLELKGLCTVIQGTVKEYQASQPDSAINELILQRENEVKALQQIGRSIKETLANRIQSNTKKLVEVLSSKHAQVNKFDVILNQTEHLLLSFNKAPYATGYNRSRHEIVEASKPLQNIINKGVKVKALFEIEDNPSEAFFQLLDYYQSLGEEIRMSPSLPLKMLMADSKTAMVSMKSSEESRFELTSMVFTHSDLTEALNLLFNFLWDASIPYETYKKSIKKIVK